MKTFTKAVTILAICGVLTSCSSEDYSYPDYNWKDGLIVNVGGKNYQFSDIYDLMDGKKDSAKAYYSTAKNILAQLITPRTDTILSQADSYIKQQEASWKSSADTNGTTYKEEMEKALKAAGCDDEEALRNKQIASYQNEKNSTDFYSEQQGTTDTDSKFMISESETKKFVSETSPYHVSHILVKVDASSDGTSTWAGEISSDDAKQIGNVLNSLSSTNTFGITAKTQSDDTSSGTLYGELYTAGDTGASIAMTKSTSYIQEFKYGLYAYDAYLNPDTKDNAALKTSLRVPGHSEDSAVADEITDTQVGQGKAYGIPLSQAFSLQYEADQTTSDDGLSVTDATAKQYPRNIIFNNYFNNHGVSFVYDDSSDYDARFVAECKEIDSTVNSVEDANTKLPERYKEYKFVKSRLDAISADKFKTVSTISSNLVSLKYNTSSKKVETTAVTGAKKILADENGNPIIVVRGGSSDYQGIHFIIVNKDPFVDSDNAYNYYRINLPDADSTKKAYSTDYDTNPSFVNFVSADANSNATYKKRIESVKSVIKSYDSNMEFKLWEDNLAKFKAKYNTDFVSLLGTDAADLINSYITYTRSSSLNSANDSLDSAWETYVRTLNLQQTNASRVTPSVCVSYFESGSYDKDQEVLCNVK